VIEENVDDGACQPAEDDIDERPVDGDLRHRVVDRECGRLER
jgi:hypothetical protein